ncbi:MAG: von Willebrand factor type A domain-containing protein [Bacteroidetes bacterium]|nr:von Willebrand factor type A domain-containing protein [Bacteroidota bacterium]
MKRSTTLMKPIVLLSLMMILALSMKAWSLTTGSIKGKVLDEKGEGLIGATVQIIHANGKTTGQSSGADLDGNYEISNLMQGKYDLKCAYIGYETQLIKGVVVSAEKPTILNFPMKVQAVNPAADVVVTCVKYCKPLIDRGDTKIETTISARDIKNSGGLNVANIASQAYGVTQTDAGGHSVVINGGRPDEVQYIVNGHRVIGNVNIPAQASARLRVNKFLSGYDMAEYDMEAAPDMQSKPDEKPKADPETDESYKEIIDNKFLSAKAEPLSTFSIDVDVASYGITRRKIVEGILPPRDAVRLEELVNYFPYQYADPTDGRPFAVHTELADCPWDATHKLLRVGIQGKHIKDEQIPPANLVFLVDVSGSMWSPDKLPLVQKSLGMLVDKMRAQDRIALVVYAGNAGLVLPSTSGSDKQTIKNAINALQAGGSTAGGAGIELAYKVAKDNFIKEGNNRVLLCTDGDFNVGINGEAPLTSFIEGKRKTGVFLSVLGFGMGNYKDREMEALADKGNGNYAYIDNEKEAQKNLVTQFSGTLNTIAKDVKIQAVFNPGTVRTYRLIGYENRKLNNQDFSNDKIDAGEIGAGTAVTALYEVVPAPGAEEASIPLADSGSDARVALSASDLMALRIRYKAPDGDRSQLIESHVSTTAGALSTTSDDFRFAAAVASFGMELRQSPYRGDFTFEKTKALAKGALGPDKENYRHDFITMIDQAASIASKTAYK